MRTPVRSRGFTLLELLVGAAVGAVVLLGISLTFISQARQYQAHASRRGVQANSRQAMAFMTRQLRTAGYGVNPDRAILAYDSYDAAADAQAIGFPDAVVIHSRDLLFRRPVQAANANAIALPPTEPLTQEMRMGQILLVLCPQAREHAFVTVGQTIPPGSIAIPLDPTAPAAAPNSPTRGPGRLFHEQQLLNTRVCFSQPGTQIVMVNRAAFYVATFDSDGDPGTTGNTPYLMMHQGLDMNLDGEINANDAVPVAEGIEQLQVAYVLNSIDNSTPAIRGVNEAPMMPPVYYGENWESIDLANLPPNWAFDTTVARVTRNTRLTSDHSANIRQVRVTMVARSTVADPQIPGDDMMSANMGDPLPDGTVPWQQLENLGTPVAPDFNPSGGGFYRVLLRESVTPKNLQMNAQFPPVSFAPGVLAGGG